MHYASLLEMQAELKDQSGRITVLYFILRGHSYAFSWRFRLLLSLLKLCQAFRSDSAFC